ncbi:MAG TPA: hypothetical protein VGG69_11890 [Rhizomicrobium sp.]
MRRVLLLILSLLLLTAAVVALFPAKIITLATGWNVEGFSVSFHDELVGFGGGAIVAAVWAFISAFRRRG